MTLSLRRNLLIATGACVALAAFGGPAYAGSAPAGAALAEPAVSVSLWRPTPANPTGATPSATRSPSPSVSPDTPPADTGTITGTLVPWTWVNVQSAGGSGSDYYSTSADAGGRYTITGVQPGSYIVDFGVADGRLVQYVPQAVSYSGARPYAVSAGKTTTISDTALPTGTVAGRFVDQAGKPVAGSVSLSDSGQGAHSHVLIMADGAYAAPAFPGTYTVKFDVTGGMPQYAYQQTGEATAKQFAVAAGATVVVNDTRLPTGSLVGRILERDGTPAAGARVEVEGVTDYLWSSATTAADGTYRLDGILPGDYRARVVSADSRRSQWIKHTVDMAKATIFPIAVGRDTVADDQFIATGTLAVTVIDAVTGAPVLNYYAEINSGASWQSVRSDASGTAIFLDVPEGNTTEVSVWADGGYLQTGKTGITIIAGTVTTVTLAATPSASIEVAVVDAATGTPVAGVCLAAASQRGGNLPEYLSPCTDDHGKALVDNLRPGTYNIFAQPRDGIHGAQWVGASGGTGDQFAAAVVTVAAGATVAAPVVRLDGAGSITGTVTDESTGLPVVRACVSTTALIAAYARIPYCPGAYADSSGRYRIDNLGPYAWPVEFGSEVYAWEWSGNAVNRRRATPVTVTAGGVSTSNAQLIRGQAIAGRILDIAGTALDGTVEVYNAETGDAAGAIGPMENGSYRVLVLPQTVRVSYDVWGSTSSWSGWYKDASDFDGATSIQVGDKDVTLDLVK